MSSASRSRAELSAALRAVLLEPAEAERMEVAGHVDAAVLVPLFLGPDDVHVVLTRRNVGMRRHGGEVSFPGGRHEHAEETLQETALREAHEEIGLPPSAVEVLGALAPTPTVVT